MRYLRLPGGADEVLVPPARHLGHERGARSSDLAMRRGVAQGQLVLAWLLARAPVIVIAKAGNPRHVRDNRAAPSHWKYSAMDVTALLVLVRAVATYSPKQPVR
jgi:diketogulonate reductase-like aldo/keto reductase